MNKFEKSGLIFLILSSIAILALVFAAIGIDNKNSSLKSLIEKNRILEQQLNLSELQNTKTEERLMESRLYNKFYNIVDKIGAIPYGPEANCYDHAKMLQKQLEKEKIASSIFITPDRNHAFLGVWIEATTGSFIDPGKYSVGELRDYNLNVICD